MLPSVFEAATDWKRKQYTKFQSMCETVRRNRAGFARINCPFCPDRKNKQDVRVSFGWNEDLGVAKCWSCGYRFTMGVAGSSSYTPHVPGAFHTPREFFPISKTFTHPVANGIRLYLYSRGMTEVEIIIGDVHGTTGSREAGRAIFPHKNPDGSWWGYTARQVPGMCDFGGKVNCPFDVDKTKLYNEVALEADTDAPLMVVEGVIDAIRYMPDVVACLGKGYASLFEKLLDRAKRGCKTRPIVFCFDGDAADTSRSLVRRLRRRGFRCSCVILPPGMDPDRVAAEWLREEVNKTQE